MGSGTGSGPDGADMPEGGPLTTVGPAPEEAPGDVPEEMPKEVMAAPERSRSGRIRRRTGDAAGLSSGCSHGRMVRPVGDLGIICFGAPSSTRRSWGGLTTKGTVGWTGR